MAQVPTVIWQAYFVQKKHEQIVVAHHLGYSQVLKGDEEEESAAKNEPRENLTDDVMRRVDKLLIERFFIGDVLCRPSRVCVLTREHSNFAEEAHKESYVGSVHQDCLIFHPGLLVEVSWQLAPVDLANLDKTIVQRCPLFLPTHRQLEHL